MFFCISRGSTGKRERERKINLAHIEELVCLLVCCFIIFFTSTVPRVDYLRGNNVLKVENDILSLTMNASESSDDISDDSV